MTKLEKRFEFEIPLNRQGVSNRQLSRIHEGDLIVGGVAYKRKDGTEIEPDVDKLQFRSHGSRIAVDIMPLRWQFDDLSDRVLIATRHHVESLVWEEEHPLIHETIGSL